MSADLSVVVREICERAGLSEDQIDVSDLEGVEVEGFLLANFTPARRALEPLRIAGLFDVIESGGQLKFVRRGKASVATLEEAELGAHFEGDEPPPLVTTRKTQDYELPRQVRLRYVAKARDYERGEQLSPARFTTESVNEATIDLPVVLTDERAAELAEIAYRDAWASRYTHQLSVGQDLAELEPADVVLLPIDGRLYRCRIVQIQETVPVIRRLRAVRDDDNAYVSAALADPPFRPDVLVELIGDTELVFLDLPALREEDDDPGIYVAARRTGTGASWSGAVIHKSMDGGATYSQLAAVTAQATIGTVVTAPSGQPYTWDDDAELVVDLLSGSLASRTDAAVLGGANAVAIGAHGRWHLCQFANQALVSADRYSLTRMLLGRRGTEHLVDSVQVGDTFLLVSGSGIYRLPLQTSEIGQEKTYRAVTSGAPFDSGADVAFTGDGQALEPFSPVHVRGSRDGSDNLTISWVRRDRLSETLRDGVAVPNSETSEAYEVDILDGSTVVRTIEGLSSPQASYTAAEQTTDFGSPQSDIDVRVYQLSAVVGRGAPAEATV